MFWLIPRSFQEVAARVGYRVRSKAAAAVESLARRPRGQQLLRQADRILEVVERVARWTGTGDGLHAGGYFPVSMLSMVPLVFIVLPSFFFTMAIATLPVWPVLVPAVVLGPIVNVLYDGTLSTYLSYFPTPLKISSFIRRRRRALRTTRLNGVREMRGDSKVPDSFISMLFIWWPVGIFAIIGQLMGFGGPYLPARWSPTVCKKGDSEVSPRKRKLNHIEQISDGECQTRNLASSKSKPEATSSEDSEWDSAAELSDILDVGALSETILALDFSRKLAESSESDSEYQPEDDVRVETNEDDDDEEEEEEEEEDEEDEEDEDEDAVVEKEAKEDGQEMFSTPDKKNHLHQTSTKEMEDAEATPTSQKMEEIKIPKIIVNEASGLSTPQTVSENELSLPILLDNSSNGNFSTPQGSETDLRSPQKHGEESQLLLEAETDAATKESPVREKDSAEFVVTNPESKEADDVGTTDDARLQEDFMNKGEAKAKPLFGGLFKRK